MKITEILKKSFKYPTSNIKGYLLFGVLIVLANLKFITGLTSQYNIVFIGMMISLIAFISYLLLSGFDILVIKEGIKRSNEFPQMNLNLQLENGAKNIIIAIIYFLIPFIISIIIAFIMKIPQKINELVNASQAMVIKNSVNGTVAQFDHTILQSIPNTDSILTVLGIFAIFVIILVIIFGIFYSVAKCRLAKYESIKSALNIPELIEDLKKIGFGKYIATYFIMVIIIFAILFVCGNVLGFVSVLFSSISMPAATYVVALITFLLINPFIYLFQAQTLGLLYSEVE